MNDFIQTFLGATTANILTFLVYKGFVKSYWGQNAREEITRWFNRFKKD